MGFFKSKEEKEAEKAQAQQQMIKVALQQMGLDFDNYTEEDIKRENKKDIEKMSSQRMFQGLRDWSMTLGLNTFQQSLIFNLNAIFRQNLIIIRQLELIARLLRRQKKGGERKE